MEINDIDESLQELKNKQEQFELEVKQKMLLTFQMMSENTKRLMNQVKNC